MTPTSQVVQLVSWIAGFMFLALCEDGSVWFFKPGNKSCPWEKIAEMDKGKYI